MWIVENLPWGNVIAHILVLKVLAKMLEGEIICCGKSGHDSSPFTASCEDREDQVLLSLSLSISTTDKSLETK